jgi:hypothetical protein
MDKRYGIYTKAGWRNIEMIEDYEEGDELGGL